jgi:hypothetical protein
VLCVKILFYFFLDEIGYFKFDELRVCKCFVKNSISNSNYTFYYYCFYYGDIIVWICCHHIFFHISSFFSFHRVNQWIYKLRSSLTYVTLNMEKSKDMILSYMCEGLLKRIEGVFLSLISESLLRKIEGV